jgi:hypothetical protein
MLNSIVNCSMPDGAVGGGEHLDASRGAIVAAVLQMRVVIFVFANDSTEAFPPPPTMEIEFIMHQLARVPTRAYLIGWEIWSSRTFRFGRANSINWDISINDALDYIVNETDEPE